MPIERAALEVPGGAGLRAWIAHPGAPNGAGLLVVHGESGLGCCAAALERCAAQGFTALAPDLFSRELGAEPAPAELASAAASLSDRRAQADLECAAAALAAQPGVDARKLAALGFGAGGTLAFLFLCKSARLQAAVMFGGTLVYPALGEAHPVQPLELALNLSGALLGLFGAEDARTPPAHVAALEETLARFAKRAEVHVLDGAGREFCEAQGHAAPAAERAWQLAFAFLRAELELD